MSKRNMARKNLVIVCDNMHQYKLYYDTIVTDVHETVHVYPVYDMHSATRVKGLDTADTEVRFIGSKAVHAYLTLDSNFGVE